MKIAHFVFILVLIAVTLPCRSQSVPLQLGGTTTSSRLKENGVATLIFSATNAAATTCNIIQMTRIDENRSNAAFGILLGAAQAGFGTFNTNWPGKNPGIFPPINIGVGLLTIASSITRIIKKRPENENKISFKMFCFPLANRCVPGFSLVHRIGGRS